MKELLRRNLGLKLLSLLIAYLAWTVVVGRPAVVTISRIPVRIKPGPTMVSQPIELHLEHDRPRGRDAYDRLLGDALRGDPSLFARQDGVMEAWRIVDETLSGCRCVVPYERGSWGPREADALLRPSWTWITK